LSASAPGLGCAVAGATREHVCPEFAEGCAFLVEGFVVVVVCPYGGRVPARDERHTGLTRVHPGNGHML
jgi:hypothetical protein